MGALACQVGTVEFAYRSLEVEIFCRFAHLDGAASVSRPGRGIVVKGLAEAGACESATRRSVIQKFGVNVGRGFHPSPRPMEVQGSRS